MYTFTIKPVATIRAKLKGDEVNSVNVAGTNPSSTPDNAKTQINKILALTSDKQVVLEGMTRTFTEEAFDNG